MNKIKCSSCGGHMTIDETKEYATCAYCGTTYKLNEDLNVNVNFGDVNIKLDDNVKELLDNKMQNNHSKLTFIPFVIFFMIFIIIIFNFFSINNKKIDDINDSKNEINIKQFNGQFEILSGTQSKFFVSNLLDHVVTSNKTNTSHIITVVYQENNITDTDEIVELKHSLNDNQYEILLDYDEDGYVNKINIKEL